jgi:hypothetical protein
MRATSLFTLLLASAACSSQGIVTGYPLPGVSSGTEILAVSPHPACPPDQACAKLFVYALDGSRLHTELAQNGEADLDLEAEIFDVLPSSIFLQVGSQPPVAIGQPVADLPDAKALCRLRIRSGRADGDWTCSSSVGSDRRTFRLPAPSPCFTLEKRTLVDAEPQTIVPLDPLIAYRNGYRGRVVSEGDSIYVAHCPVSSATSGCSRSALSTLFTLGRSSVSDVSSVTAAPALGSLVDGWADIRHFAAASPDSVALYDRTASRTAYVLPTSNVHELAYTSTGSYVLIGASPGVLFGAGVFDLAPRWMETTPDPVRGIAHRGGSEAMAHSDRGLFTIGLDGQGLRFLPFEASIDGTRLGQLCFSPATPSSPVLAASQGQTLVLRLSDSDQGGAVHASASLVLRDPTTGDALEALAWSVVPLVGTSRFAVVAFTTVDQKAFVAAFDPSTMRFIAAPQEIGAGPIDTLAHDDRSDLWTFLPWSSDLVHVMRNPGCVPE